MTVIRQDVLQQAGRRNKPLLKWLTAWVAAVQSSSWNKLADVRKKYPTADGVKLESEFVVTIFNVKGNEYRLLTSIDYEGRIVEVLDVLTHAEYDKNQWKLKY